MTIKLVIACTINHDQVNSQSISVGLEVDGDGATVFDPANLDDRFRHLCAVIFQALINELDLSRVSEDRSPLANAPSVP